MSPFQHKDIHFHFQSQQFLLSYSENIYLLFTWMINQWKENTILKNNNKKELRNKIRKIKIKYTLPSKTVILQNLKWKLKSTNCSLPTRYQRIEMKIYFMLIWLNWMYFLWNIILFIEFNRKLSSRCYEHDKYYLLKKLLGFFWFFFIFANFKFNLTAIKTVDEGGIHLLFEKFI